MEARAGERSVALGGGRQLKLFAFLLVNANRAVSGDALIDAVWGPERNGATKRLQVAIARLRRGLEPLAAGDQSVVRTVSGGYLLAVGRGELDAEVFADRVAEGRRALTEGDPALASQLLGAALDLWRGPPLAEVAFEEFAQGEIRRLEELRLVAVGARGQALLQMGAHAQLIGELESHLVGHPTREQLAGLLMLALYRSGRQADALEVYQRTRGRLSEELGLEPGPALRALQAQILEQAPTLDTWQERSDASPGAHLADDAEPDDQAEGVRQRGAAVPVPATATIGRERDIAAVSSLLVREDVRMVTLTGPGGVGKTRLALAVAHEVGLSFPDGAHWVELAGVSRPEDVASAIMRSLALIPVDGESAVDALHRYLANKRMLLALDNFEHVLDAAGLVGELHAVSPGVAILATSREPLNLIAEHRIVVAPLAVPTTSMTVGVAEVEATDASALFLAAARRHDNQFEVVAATAPAVARICAALDGLPLALELAAARTGLLTLDELAERLDDTVAHVGGGPRDAPARQRTLRATIDWSYRLLDPDQQDVFIGCSVFAGGATLNAAQTITGASLETLEALVAKSLIEPRTQRDGSTRLWMLETLRADAAERLARRPEQTDLHRRHFDFYLALAEQLNSRLSTHEEGRALTVLASEVDNLVTALRWALDVAPGAALRLAGHLGQYCNIRASPDALHWLEAALRAAGEDAPAEDRARAQLQRAYQLRHHEDTGTWNQANREALALYCEIGDDGGLALAYGSLASAASEGGDVRGARRYAELACRHARRVDDDVLLGQALARLALTLPAAEGRLLLDQAGELLQQVGGYRELAQSFLTAAYMSLIDDRVTEALGRLDVALAVLPKIDNPATEMFLRGNLGLAKLFSGALEEARAAFDRQLRLCVGQSFRFGADEGLAGLAAVLASEGQTEQAARLWGAARSMGYPPGGVDDVIAERLDREYFASAQAECGITTWSKAEQAGSQLSYEDAIAYALEQSQPRPRPDNRAQQAPQDEIATVFRLRDSNAPKQRTQRRTRGS